MAVFIPVFISIIALLVTFYQLHLQRIHNEKSLKPLPQIDFTDRDGLLFVRVQNNGVGPMIIEKLTFYKGDKAYFRIQDCLSFEPTTYEHIDVNDTNKKVIIQGGFLELFSVEIKNAEQKIHADDFRRQLSVLKLKIEGWDIYDNKVSIEKSLHWFVRHKKE